MDFFIKEGNIRGGNRGGKNLFNWNDVRLLSSRDRQSYLGSTQALGLMDRGGKLYKRDWWTHYNTPINVYGQKDKLNNREALLEEQKEIRIKEREKLNEVIYGKKKNNNIILNEDELLSKTGSIFKHESLENNLIKKEFDVLSRPGLGKNNHSSININNMNNEINDDKKEFVDKSIKTAENIINKYDNKKNSHHHYHRSHHKHHKNHKSRSKQKVRLRSRDKKDKKKDSDSETSYAN